MDSISKDLRDSLLEVDVEEADEWPRLRNWAKDFRRKYKLTVSEFLRVMDSDKDSIYFAQLLSSSKRSPSKRSGYLSFQLREDLTNFRNKIVSEGDITAKDVSLEDRIENLEDRIEDGLAEYELTQPFSFTINITKFKGDLVELSVSTVGNEDSDQIRSRVEKEFSEFLKDALNIVIVVKVTEVMYAQYVASFIGGELWGTGTTISVSEKTIGVTARHVLFSDDQTSDDKVVNIIEHAVNGEYLVCSESVPHGFTSRSMQHAELDVGCYEVNAPSVAKVDSLIEFGAITVPSKDFSLQLQRSMKNNMDGFILAKYGCITKYTSGTIHSIGRSRIEIGALGYGPIAFHGDSGSLWIVTQSPEDKFDGVIAGVTTAIHAKVVDDRVVGISKCIVAPVWSWIDHVNEVVNPTRQIDTVIGSHVMKGLYIVDDIEVGSTGRKPAKRSISQRSASMSLLIPTFMFVFSWVLTSLKI